ncbi:helix-turn-helix domain-containing protein [Sphingobium fuliginis]|uniref:Helix-turn-helix transcriptional regulator n=1 Tax=Sphingobium fuliginis ATCC 27551 TaxID=1208342 RepID=A0A5B8CNL3_SPHSA|nr:helix-turn-helix transcriptional regulator [Sphingobium fuliginis]QDC40262.1 helix-turn-helix transcriptional regulator [Sphingobium fuliginis ATCC 27551]
MIKNQQQYRIARRELAALHHEIASASEQGRQKEKKASQNAETISRISLLETKIQIYERLQARNTHLLPMESLQDLPELLIAARIARGMTQKDLAEFMGMRQQQIQMYEGERYQSATLGRLSRFADALGVSVHQVGELAGSRFLGEVDPARVSCFPIGEMYRRGWLGPYGGSLIEARHVAHQHLIDFFGRAYGVPPRSRRRYARTNGIPHGPSQENATQRR